MIMINTILLKNLTKYFTSTLAQANLANKSDNANFVKKTYFDDKLKKLNKNPISNKNELNEP